MPPLIESSRAPRFPSGVKVRRTRVGVHLFDAATGICASPGLPGTLMFRGLSGDGFGRLQAEQRCCPDRSLAGSCPDTNLVRTGLTPYLARRRALRQSDRRQPCRKRPPITQALPRPYPNPLLVALRCAERSGSGRPGHAAVHCRALLVADSDAPAGHARSAGVDTKHGERSRVTNRAGEREPRMRRVRENIAASQEVAGGAAVAVLSAVAPGDRLRAVLGLDTNAGVSTEAAALERPGLPVARLRPPVRESKTYYMVTTLDRRGPQGHCKVARQRPALWRCGG